MVKYGKKVNLASINGDEIPIKRDIFFSGAYVIELPLDSQPDYVWQTIFEQEWKSSLYLWERKAVIVGDKLLLVTTPVEIEKKIDWVKRVIESTNAHVARFVQTQQTVEEVGKTEELRKHENIIRDSLRTKFDLR